MRIKTFFLTFLALILFTACENLNDIGSLDTKYSVFINLTVNQNKQEFYFYKTLPIEVAINGYPFGSNDEFFVGNPYISFTDENGNIFDNFILEMRPEGYINRKYITNNSEFFIIPESGYKVQIQIDDVEIESTINTLPKIDSYKLEFGEEKNEGGLIITPIIFSWKNIDNAMYYIVERIHYYTYQFNDSTLFSSSNNKFDYFHADQAVYAITYNTSSESDSLKITLTAFDINLFQHFLQKNDQVNLTNAYGYIGSSSVIDTLIKLK